MRKYYNIQVTMLFMFLHILNYVLFFYSLAPLHIWQFVYNKYATSEKNNCLIDYSPYYVYDDFLSENVKFVIVNISIFMIVTLISILTYHIVHRNKIYKSTCEWLSIPIFVVIFTCCNILIEDDSYKYLLIFGIIGTSYVFVYFIPCYVYALKCDFRNVYPFGFAYVYNKDKLYEEYIHGLRENYIIDLAGRINKKYINIDIKKIEEEKENPDFKCNLYWYYDNGNLYPNFSYIFKIRLIANYEFNKENILSKWYYDYISEPLKKIEGFPRYKWLKFIDTNRNKLQEEFADVKNRCTKIMKNITLAANPTLFLDSLFLYDHGSLEGFYSIEDYQNFIDKVRNKELEIKNRDEIRNEEKGKWLTYLESHKSEIIAELKKHSGTKDKDPKSFDSIEEYTMEIESEKRFEALLIEHDKYLRWLSENESSVLKLFNNASKKAASLYLTNKDFEYTIDELKNMSKAQFDRRQSIAKMNEQEYSKFCSRFESKIAGIPYCHIWNYIPKRERFVDMLDAENSRKILAFKEGKEVDLVSDKVSEKLIELFKELKMTTKDEKSHAINLDSFLLVCIPASSQLKYVIRYREFLTELHKKCGINVAFDKIVIEDGVTANHLGGNERPRINIEMKWFEGKKVILFDDIVTSGNTMKYYIEAFKSIGAQIVCCLSLGKTC